MAVILARLLSTSPLALGLHLNTHLLLIVLLLGGRSMISHTFSRNMFVSSSSMAVSHRFESIHVTAS